MKTYTVEIDDTFEFWHGVIRASQKLDIIVEAFRKMREEFRYGAFASEHRVAAGELQENKIKAITITVYSKDDLKELLRKIEDRTLDFFDRPEDYYPKLVDYLKHRMTYVADRRYNPWQSFGTEPWQLLIGFDFLLEEE